MTAKTTRAIRTPSRVRHFHELRLSSPLALADEVVGLLADAARGASCEPCGDGTAVVRVYFDDPRDARRARTIARRAFAGWGLGGDLPAGKISRVEDQPWVERYQRTLEPFDLGSGFRVIPRGGTPRQAAAGERIPIRLAPGRAFGTGQHATTALCVELVERLVRPGSSWLDLGCGTAILAIVAAHRGAREVLALDVDPEAVAVARRVVSANGLAGRIGVEVGSVREGARRSWDGVVSNVEAPFFLREAGPLTRLLSGGGRLIVSGLLARDVASVSRAFRQEGLGVLEQHARGAWSALALGRTSEA